MNSDLDLTDFTLKVSAQGISLTLLAIQWLDTGCSLNDYDIIITLLLLSMVAVASKMLKYAFIRHLNTAVLVVTLIFHFICYQIPPVLLAPTIAILSFLHLLYLGFADIKNRENHQLVVCVGGLLWLYLSFLDWRSHLEGKSKILLAITGAFFLIAHYRKFEFLRSFYSNIELT